MAVSASLLTNGGTGVDASSFNTASVTPGANRLILVWFHTNSSVATSVTGNGLTWELVDDDPGSGNPISCWRSMGGSPSAGAITINFGGTQSEINWCVVEYDGVDTSGSNGSGAIVQTAANSAASGTSLTITLSSGIGAGNAVAAAIAHGTVESQTPGSGYTKLGEFSSSAEIGNIAHEWAATGTTTPSMTWSSSDNNRGIAVEIKVAGGAAAVAQGSSARRGPGFRRGPTKRFDLLRAYRVRHRDTTVSAGDVRADTGLGTVGLSADATVKKVAVVTARSTLGLSGTAGAAKVSKSTGLGELGVTSTITAKKAAPAAGISTVGLAAVSTARKVSKNTGIGAVGLAANFVHADIHPITAVATVGLTATNTARKVGQAALNAPVGLAGIVTTKKVSRPSATSTAGLAGIATARKVSKNTGIGALGLTATHSGTLPRIITALGTLGLTSTSTGLKKRSTPQAAGIFGLSGNALPRKISKSTGVGAVGLEPLAIAGKRQTVTGRATIGLAAFFIPPPEVPFGGNITGTWRLYTDLGAGQRRSADLTGSKQDTATITGG